MPDALCVSGPITSQPADASGLAEVAQAVTGSGVPVLVNTGFRAENAHELLRFADGAVVGSSLKIDGITWNPVDRAPRARADGRRPRGQLSGRRIFHNSCNSRHLGCE